MILMASTETKAIEHVEYSLSLYLENLLKLFSEFCDFIKSLLFQAPSLAPAIGSIAAFRLHLLSIYRCSCIICSEIVARQTCIHSSNAFRSINGSPCSDSRGLLAACSMKEFVKDKPYCKASKFCVYTYVTLSQHDSAEGRLHTQGSCNGQHWLYHLQPKHKHTNLTSSWKL